MIQKIYQPLGILAILFMVTFFGCEKFLDVNDNPTKINDAPVNVLLPNVIERMANMHYSLGSMSGRITHQLDHEVLGYYDDVRLTSLWTRVYLNVLVNVDEIIAKSEEDGSAHYVGIAKTLKALTLGLLTDTFENAPFSEAVQGSLNITPGYDSQQEIYDGVFSLLNEALSALETEESFHIPGNDDLAYGGDINKWIKLVHTLKARYMLHLSNKASIDWTKVMEEASLGLSENDDNFQITYTAANPNPWFTNVAVANETGNLSVAPADYFVNQMNNDDGTVNDPRISKMISLDAADTTGMYIGLNSWDVDAPSYNCFISRNTFYGIEEAPMLMVSAAESKLIAAEAALHTGGDADSFVKDAVALNMAMLGVAADDATTYLDALPTAAISTIMKEKMVVLFLNGEFWTDMRRHHFDPAVFVGFVEPDYQGRSKPAQRSRYPQSELTRNEANYSAHIKEITDGMWRDMN